MPWTEFFDEESEAAVTKLNNFTHENKIIDVYYVVVVLGDVAKSSILVKYVEKSKVAKK